jgi:hypothetical protein
LATLLTTILLGRSRKSQYQHQCKNSDKCFHS